MYDDFNNSAYDGGYNKSLWNVYTDSKSYVVSQSEGKMSLSVTDQSEVSLGRGYPKIAEPSFFEARLYLDPQTTNSGTHLVIELGNADGFSICYISRTGDFAQQIVCYSEYYGKKVDAEINVSGILPGWHILRFEIDPETMTISSVVDGGQVAQFIPEEVIPDHFNEFKQSSYNFSITLHNLGPSKAPVGYIDYVRIGAIEDDPTVYDSFNDTTYDGRFNQNLWWYDPDGHSLKTESEQQDGLLVITQSGIDQTSFLALKEYWGKSSHSNMYFEANFRVEMSSDGVISLGILDLGSCGLHTHSDWVDAYCGNSEYYRDIRVTHGSWNTFRIEINVDENLVRYFINGELLGENRLDNLLKSPILHPHIGISSGTNRVENTRPVVAYVDNVRVGPLEYVNP
jgi:hypothetical protein